MKILSLVLFGRIAFGANFSEMVDRYFETYFENQPTLATSLGVHSYDKKLADMSRGHILAHIELQKKQLAEFKTISPKTLSKDEAIDWELITNQIQAKLLEEETLRLWERDPDRYSSGITESVYNLMARKYAADEERLGAIIAREEAAPKWFAVARENLKNPPKIYTEIALEQIPGAISFFEKDVPATFAHIKDKKLQTAFRKSNGRVISELKKYEKFLKTGLLPKSKGDFKLGAENYSLKLKFEEMVEMPLDQLLEIGYTNLREKQKRFKEVAKKIDPKKTYEEVLHDLEKDHPKPENLLQSVRDVMGGLRKFLVERKIVSIPSEIEPIIQETPPFQRAVVMASMDTPGPFEQVAKEAYYNVTLPEPDWPKNRVEEHMAGFNFPTVISTSVHEAYPGHYVQFLWVQSAPTKTRKILGADSNAEGWAHYTEQMILDEGYGNGDQKLRLGQLQDALLRNARFIVGIEMHRGKMTYEEGINFFVKEGFTSRANGERETKRGTGDPTYLYYTLGKLQIPKLREDYKKMMGSKFSLQEFHDTLLKQGYPPVKLLRRALLGDEKGSVL